MARNPDAAGTLGRRSRAASLSVLVASGHRPAIPASPAGAAGLLRDTAPHDLAGRLCEQARQITGAPVALYVIDIDGSGLLLLDGPAGFPERLAIAGAVGPELPLESVAEAAAAVGAQLAGAQLVPITLRDRALGAFVSQSSPPAALNGLAGQAALALELAGGYTDAVHATRRRRRIEPAAEIQQNLLPPRLARLPGATIAGGVLPGYDNGGDFFDYASNRDGLWLAIGDGMGKGNNAAALASLAIGALRAARRSDATLSEAVQLMHETVHGTGTPTQFVTAIIARFNAETRILEWINCGHPPPLLITHDGSCSELTRPAQLPLGLFAGHRKFHTATCRLAADTRLLLYSDGITERRTQTGTRLEMSGVHGTLRALGPASAPQTVRALQDAISNASPQPLKDDATLLVLAPDA
jgi:hypothetical protein